MKPAIAFLVIAFGGAMLGQAFNHWWWSLPAMAILLGGFVLQRNVRTPAVTEARELRKTEAVPRKVMVMFLSTTELPFPEYVDITGQLDEDLRHLANYERDNPQARRWNWAQPLRSIHHNIKDGRPLKRLVVVCSPESIGQLRDFVEGVVWKYAEPRNLGVDVFVNQGGGRLTAYENFAAGKQRLDAGLGWDFEDFTKLTRGLNRLFELLRQEGCRMLDVAVDFTGGQKPTSVVAAAVTIGSHVANLYVPTHGEAGPDGQWTYKPLSYDLIKLSSDE